MGLHSTLNVVFHATMKLKIRIGITDEANDNAQNINQKTLDAFSDVCNHKQPWYYDL